MFSSIRVRIMIAALIFAVAWALGVAIHSITHASLTIISLTIGSIAFAYLVSEYHRAWRLYPASPVARLSLGFKNWSGVNAYGATIRPEYITAAIALLICAIGIYEYFKASSRPPIPTIPKSPPALLLPKSRPLQ